MSELNTKTCKICGNEANMVTATCRGYIDGSLFKIFHCDDCDTNFADNTDFDIDIYQMIYAQPEKIPGYNRYHYIAKTITNIPEPLNFLSEFEPMYWAAKRFITTGNPDKKAKILEVGSGLGYLTYAMRQAGYDATGVDISENAVRNASQRFGNFYIAADIFEYYKANKNSYDYIILTEVIEHLENPVPFVACLLEMLKDNGKILITTPNKSVNIPGAAWTTELPPVHLWWFSERSAEVIAKQLNSKVSFIDFTGFNKTHFDKVRFKIYKGYEFGSTLNKAGQAIAPQEWVPSATTGFKASMQKAVAHLAAYEPFNSLLTRKEFPVNKSSTLAFILSK